MSEQATQFDSIDTALAAIKVGKLIIVVDDKERENEGDFICAAETITPEVVDFMLRRGSGVLCIPLVQEVANRLRLSPLAENDVSNAPHKTHFLIQIDHRDAGTGVSAANRCKTIRALVDDSSTAEDFYRPGHLSPLLAKEGGVLRRAGHTEATIDLMRMAGMKPVGALIEICSERTDGMADADELHEIAREHGIPIISIEDLIRHRRLREQLVHREAEVKIKLADYGTPCVIPYRVEHEDQVPMALVWGDLSLTEAPLVRVHSSCFTGDVLGSLRCDCGDQLHMAMKIISNEGAGVVVYLPQEGRGIGLVAKLKAYQLQDQGLDTVEANHKLGFKADQRDYMIGLQILKDLGLSKVRLLTNNPKKTESFENTWDLKVVEQVPIVATPHQHNIHYLNTKRDKLGHKLPPSIGDAATG